MNELKRDPWGIYTCVHLDPIFRTGVFTRFLDHKETIENKEHIVSILPQTFVLYVDVGHGEQFCFSGIYIHLFLQRNYFLPM